MSKGIAWRSLITRFVEGQMTAKAFEKAFLTAWHHERDAATRVPFAVDRLFYEVDAYCADPDLRAPADLDDEGLTRAAIRALDEFDAPWPEIGQGAKRPVDRRLH
jgi:hypothetical protein